MKSVAALAVAAALLAGSTLSSTAAPRSGAASHSSRQIATIRTARWFGPTGFHLTRITQIQNWAGSDQAADSGTPTDTPTPTATTAPSPTPTATSTTSNLPDASTLLTTMANLLQVVKSVHFQEIALQTGAVDLSIKDTGDATCTGLAVKAHVTAKATVPGTSQSQSDTFDLIRIKNKDYWKDSKHTHGLWQPTTEKKLSNYEFGFEIMSPGVNPLGCYTSLLASSGSGSGGSGQGVQDQLTGLTNTGETKFNNTDVYDIHAVDVQLDPTTNQTTDTPIDWYVGVAHALLYGTLVTFNDTANAVQGSVTQKFSKYGEKFSQTAPKKGSKTP